MQNRLYLSLLSQSTTKCSHLKQRLRTDYPMSPSSLKPSWPSPLLFCLITAFALCLSVLTCLPSYAEEPTNLPEITVYESRFGAKIDGTLPQITIINRFEIAQSGLTDVTQILQKLGNIQTRINLNGTQDLSIDLRGYGVNSDNNVVILLDGNRLSEIEQASARLSMIPVEAIDHIEILRGGSSVLYGDGATSGVINIISKRRSGDITTVSGKAGSFGAKETNLYASRQRENILFSVYGKTLNTDNYRQNNAAQVRSVGGTFQWQPSAAAAFGVRLYVDEQNTRLPGSLTFGQLQLNPRLSTNPNDYGSTRGDAANIFASTLYGNAEFAIDIFARNKNASSTLPSLGGTTTSAATSLGFSPRVKVHDALIGGNELTFGVDVSKWDRTYSSIYPLFPWFSTVGEQLVQHSAATYFRDDWVIGPANRVTLGARVDRIQKNLTNFTAYSNPNLNNSLSAFEIQYTRSMRHEWQAYVRNAQSYRVPNIDDLRGAGASLVPQTSTDYEIGLTMHRLARANAKIRIFKSRINNEIVYDPVQFLNVNLPPTRREGVELEGRYEATNTVALRGAWQKIRALFVQGGFQGNHIPMVPSFSAQMGIEWKPAQQQSLDLSARFVGQQYVDGDFNNGLTPIPFFWTADIRYSAELSKNVDLVVAVNNLMNKKYYDYANSAGGYYPSPGFNGSGMLRFRF